MLKRATIQEVDLGPIGLDDRPRPASSRERIVKGLKQSAPFSSLQRRIIFFNLVGLALLVIGMTYLSNDQRNLVAVYVDALRKQGEIIAITLAETAQVDEDGNLVYDADRARTIMTRISEPTGMRIRLFDETRMLKADTYTSSPTGPPIETLPLSAPAGSSGTGISSNIDSLYREFMRTVVEDADTYSEITTPGVSDDDEVIRASQGSIAHSIRANGQGELIVSVALPVKRVKAILGVIQLSTRGGDIERFLVRERKSVIEIFFLAAIVSILLSILLANMIARPIRQLARAANIEGSSAARPVSPDKPEIPDMTWRSDEIGDLSGALIRMTGALYNRVDAIEAFAADVAHEIKNPLTSLRSAVETMQYARTDAQRQQLLDIIMNDTKRMDRLVTDISNASRLDAELVRERMEGFDMSELIMALAQVTATEGAEIDVTLEAQLPDEDLIAHGLQSRIAQVITNLLGNALSFSPAGGKIIIRGMYLRTGGVRVEVDDNGPGIPDENLGSIFERFYSERPEKEVFGSHSGLGLSISRQIVEAHGGKIWAENIPGAAGDHSPRGARFVFELPE